MGGRAAGRSGGRRARRALACAGAALVALGLAAPASVAQAVGHAPDHSPYHDIDVGNTIAVGYGVLDGSRGKVGVGPSHGGIFTVHIEHPLGRSLAAFLEGSEALTTRYVVDPTKDATTRTTGPVDNSVFIADLGFDLLLTGGKSWHGFAPFVGGVFGIATAGKVAGDTSQYSFGTKLMYGPAAGFRLYFARRLSLRVEGKILLWRLSYPLEYRITPSSCGSSPTCTPVLAVTDPLTEWTAQHVLQVRLGWTF